MKAVNLLPPSERPRPIAAAPPNASKIVLGALGLPVVAMAMFVFTKNQATDRRDSIAEAQQKKAEAEQRSQGLKAYGDFSKIKQTRVASVSDLATKRFDWERLMRELALVLPDKVWVTKVDGKTAGAAATAAGGGSSAAPSPSSTATTGSAAATPAGAGGGGSTTMTISGCAPSQKAVAETLVRLRSLAGAEDVDLKSSTAPNAEGGETAASDSAGDGSASPGSWRTMRGWMPNSPSDRRSSVLKEMTGRDTRA